MQLRNKILFYFISLIVVTLLVFGYSAYQISYDSAIENDKTVLEILVKEKSLAITKDFKKNNSLDHVFNNILDLPGENHAWIILDNNNNIIFPKQIKNLFSNDILLFPLNNLKNSSNQNGIINVKADAYLWVKTQLQGLDYSLFYIHKPPGSSYSRRFSKLASRLLIVGLIITWVAVWFSLVLSTTITKQIKYHQDAEEELNSANQLLIEAKNSAEKANQTKSEFLSNMSHEIRTPLTSIIGFAESCQDSDQTEKEQSLAIVTIIKSGKHLMRIINEILDFSKVEAGKLEIEMVPVYVMEMLDDINQLISIMAEEKGLTFCINYTYPLPEKVMSDPLRIKQILINLCSNAIKFTEQGHVYLNVAYLTKSSSLIFEVIDTGVGVEVEQQEKIFRSFEQADSSTTRNFGGSGLGLTLSKRLAKMLNGEISVVSTVNKGSCFTVKLEVVEPENSVFIHDNTYKNTIEKSNEKITEIPKLMGKVLVAEDNEDIRELVKLIIKKVGVELDVVANGQEAVEKAIESEYDLVFLDIQMPVMDGLTAMKELKQQGYRKPVIAMTANAIKNDRNMYNEVGFSNFISKPINRDYLYLLLSQYLKPMKNSKSERTVLTSNLLIKEPDLIDLIDKFISRLPIMRDAINLAHKSNKEDELSGLIHQMKGVGGGYGYPMLTELCKKIEFQIENQDYEKLNDLIEAFNAMAVKIIEGSDENHKIAEQAGV